MPDCIFCSIIRRETECSLVHEDEQSIAFLPKTPINPGHTLLMPKRHYTDIFATPSDEVLHLLTVSARIAGGIKQAVEPLRVGLVAMGLEVDHAHFHLVPIYSKLDITSQAELEGRLQTMTRHQMDALAEKVRESISSSSP